MCTGSFSVFPSWSWVWVWKINAAAKSGHVGNNQVDYQCASPLHSDANA